MRCLPPTGPSSGTVTLVWLAVLLVAVGALVLAVGRRRATDPLGALLLVGLAVAASGLVAAPAHATAGDAGCRPPVGSGPGTGSPAVIAPSTTATPPPAGATTTVASPTTSPPTTSAPTPSTVPVTVPPLTACEPVDPPTTVEVSGPGLGVVLAGPGRPWLPPAGRAVADEVALRVEVGLPTELAEGVPGPTLPVLLVPFSPLAGTVTVSGGQVRVDVDVAALHASVAEVMAVYLLDHDVAEPDAWEVVETLALRVSAAGTCPDQQVFVVAPGLLGDV